MTSLFAGPLFIPMIAIFAIGVMIALAVIFVLTLIVYRLRKHKFPKKNFYIVFALLLAVLAVVAYVDVRQTREEERRFYDRTTY